MQIYIYQLFSSVQLNIVVAMMNFTGVMLGFCLYGSYAAYRKLNSRYGFIASFTISALGILLLAISSNPAGAAFAMLIEGVGIGLFWLTIHTYELTETHDNERDIYSTYLSAGDQIVSLVGPAFATLLIALSHIIGWGEFTLLFVVVPPIFILGFIFFGTLSEYRPQPIQRHDIVHFLRDRRNKISQVYMFGSAATHIFQQIMLPLVSIVILGTALNVGGFNTLFALLSAVALLVVGQYRHANNRLLILGITSGLIAVLYIYLGISLTFVSLIIYTVGASILQPLMRVSQHVIDLQTIDDAGHSQSDFYPTMILRDFSLWVWRMLAGIVLLGGTILVGTESKALSLGLYLTAGSFVVMYVGARALLAFKSDPMR